MSLLTRVNKTVNDSTPVRQGNLPILLFETVRHFMENHTVIQAMRIDVREVHSALLDYHNMKTKESPSKSELIERKPNCRECGKGFLVIDHREGCEVCDYCGVVHAQGLNFLPDYEKGHEHRASQRGIRGVPQWMIQKIYTESRDGSSFMSELEHWNHYANISTDDLNAIAYNLDNWTKDKGSYTRAAKIAASLLYKDIKEKFPSEDAIRNHVRSASYRHVTGVTSELQEVRQEFRAPTFICPTCNFCLHDRKSARWHCKGVKGLVGLKRGRV
jgi:rubrerythrin